MRRTLMRQLVLNILLLTAVGIIGGSVKDIIYNEGDSFEFECADKQYDVSFEYPVDLEYLGVVTSPYKFLNNTYSNYLIKKKYFIRPKLVYGDTGSYRCFRNDTSKDELTLLKEIYLYVKSNISAFVESREPKVIYGYSGDTITVPCRATSPELNNITLYQYSDLKHTEILMPKAKYNPKTGFTNVLLTKRDSGHFACHGGVNNIPMNIVVYKLYIVDKPIPHITASSNQTLGADVLLNCTVTFLIRKTSQVLWILPKTDKENMMINEIRHDNGITLERIIKQLTIHNLSYGNEGIYQCLTNDGKEHLYNDYTVRVYSDAGINQTLELTSPDAGQTVKRGVNEYVAFTANISSSSGPPIITWTKDGNSEIYGDWLYNKIDKYAIQRTPFETILRINGLGIYDSGNYTVTVETAPLVKNLTFFLDVNGPPYLRMIFPYSFYTKYEQITIGYTASSNPISETLCSYRNMTDFSSVVPYSSSGVIKQDCQRNIYRKVKAFNSTVIFPIPFKNGKLTCDSCNDIKCESSTVKVKIDFDNLDDYPKGNLFCMKLGSTSKIVKNPNVVIQMDDSLTELQFVYNCYFSEDKVSSVYVVNFGNTPISHIFTRIFMTYNASTRIKIHCPTQSSTGDPIVWYKSPDPVNMPGWEDDSLRVVPLPQDNITKVRSRIYTLPYPDKDSVGVFNLTPIIDKISSYDSRFYTENNGRTLVLLKHVEMLELACEDSVLNDCIVSSALGRSATTTVAVMTTYSPYLSPLATVSIIVSCLLVAIGIPILIWKCSKRFKGLRRRVEEPPVDGSINCESDNQPNVEISENNMMALVEFDEMEMATVDSSEN